MAREYRLDPIVVDEAEEPRTGWLVDIVVVARLGRVDEEGRVVGEQEDPPVAVSPQVGLRPRPLGAVRSAASFGFGELISTKWQSS